MKIAVPSEGKDENSAVCVSFGRTLFFAVFDDESKSYEFADNAAADAPGGAGIKAAQALADMGVKTVLAPRMGGNAAAVLEAAGIPVFRTVPGTVSENVAAFLEGKLSPLTEFHQGFHGARR